MNRTVYVIPGFQGNASQKTYRELKKLIERFGFRVKIASISWDTGADIGLGSFERWSKEFLAQYRSGRKGAIVLGFSFGAIIALLTHKETRPKRLILCSMSPYFIEDRRRMPKKWFVWWNRHIQGSDLRFKDIAKNVHGATVTVLAGTREGRQCLSRARAARRQIRDSSLTIIPGAKHDLGHKPYQEALQKVFFKLSSSGV